MAAVLAQVEAEAAAAHVPMASAYCRACRASTWLCGSEEQSLSAACVQVHQHRRASEAMARALELVAQFNGKKGGLRRRRPRVLDAACLDPA